MAAGCGQETNRFHRSHKLSIGMTGTIFLMSALFYKYYLLEVYYLNAKLERLSEIDPLTKLLNKRGLWHYMKQVYEKPQPPLNAIYMIDIDCFKAYNDHYGHDEGDKVLTQIAKQLNSVCKRKTDMIARYGGEEFLVMLEGDDEKDFLSMASRMREIIESSKIPHQYSHVIPCVTISVGVAIGYIRSESDYINLMKKADQALYVSKNKGKNRCTYCKRKC